MHKEICFDLDQIQKDGANARANGMDELSNPWLMQDRMPAKTGSSVDQWQACHDAWFEGWSLEDAVRNDR